MGVCQSLGHCAGFLYKTVWSLWGVCSANSSNHKFSTLSSSQHYTCCVIDIKQYSITREHRCKFQATIFTIVSEIPCSIMPSVVWFWQYDFSVHYFTYSNYQQWQLDLKIQVQAAKQLNELWLHHLVILPQRQRMQLRLAFKPMLKFIETFPFLDIWTNI